MHIHVGQQTVQLHLPDSSPQADGALTISHPVITMADGKKALEGPATTTKCPPGCGMHYFYSQLFGQNKSQGPILPPRGPCVMSHIAPPQGYGGS